MIQERLIGYIEQSIRQNWDIEALSNYKEKGYSYKEIAEKILKLHILFKESGIKEGIKLPLSAEILQTGVLLILQQLPMELLLFLFFPILNLKI